MRSGSWSWYWYRSWHYHQNVMVMIMVRPGHGRGAWSGVGESGQAWAWSARPEEEECTSYNFRTKFFSLIYEYDVPPEKTWGRARACTWLSWLWVALLFNNLDQGGEWGVDRHHCQALSPLQTPCPRRRACCQCTICQIVSDNRNQGSASSTLAWTWRCFQKRIFIPIDFYLVRFALTSLTLLLRSSVTWRPDFFNTGALRSTESRSLK